MQRPDTMARGWKNNEGPSSEWMTGLARRPGATTC